MRPNAVTYYNEFDPKAAAWLRELIKAGLIPAGDVDERSICDISPSDLSGYTQQHFFAGIGGWAYALRLAGWPDDKPVRTGSCPCQPFSNAGLGLGEKDSRHLWPFFRDLIAFGEPTTTFGEQVASAAGRIWLARVRADLEGLGYAVGGADLCSACVGSPNIRQRLFWVADSACKQKFASNKRGLHSKPCGSGTLIGMADSNGRECRHSGLQPSRQHGQQQEDSGVGRLGNTDDAGPQGRDERGNGSGKWTPWSSSVVLPCTDGKARRIEPGSFPLAYGIPGRVGLLRGYGNAINPWIASEFIQAFCEAIN